VLVTSAASSPGIDICRSLRADPELEVVGADASPWGRTMAGRICHRVVELPVASDDPGAYADALDEACREVDFLFLSLDVEVETLVELGREPACPNPVPFECGAVILDKTRTADALPASLVPATARVETPDELDAVLERIPAPVWLRPATGTSGQGSLRVDGAEEGRTWMEFWRRRGLDAPWMVQEFLPGRNLNWTGLYRDGELLAAAAMERQAYFLAKVSVSGVTGQVSRCQTVDVPAFADASRQAVAALVDRPTGLYSVDLRGDADGRPRVTEVNPRPAGRPWLYTEAGVNLPLAAFRALTGGEPGDAVRAGGLEIGVRLHRQIDVEPLVVRD
jgi:carbamoyl-phosphate synthase large subunit